MSSTNIDRKTIVPNGSVLLAITIVGALVSTIATALSTDPLFQFQGCIFIGAFILGSFALLMGVTGDKFRSDPTQYMDGVIKAGVVATLFWGAAGMLVGVVIASQLSFPKIFYLPDFGPLNFGRLRPLHTSAVIFAFGGNALIATSFYVVQRTCRARLFGGIAPWFVFWGYQLFIDRKSVV